MTTLFVSSSPLATVISPTHAVEAARAAVAILDCGGSSDSFPWTLALGVLALALGRRKA